MLHVQKDTIIDMVTKFEKNLIMYAEFFERLSPHTNCMTLIKQFVLHASNEKTVQT